MPSARAALEKLKWMCDHGRENETVHVVMVEEEQAKRIENKQRKTRFVLVCDDPDQCAAFDAEKDRIYRRIKNKSIMISLMLVAWSEFLSDASLDKLLAKEMADEQLPNSAG